nr:unnamed protein product [Callosobruchus chinensis]
MFIRCDLCGKILVRRRDLERHLKSRHMIEMNPDMNLMKEEVKSIRDLKTEDPRTNIPLGVFAGRNQKPPTNIINPPSSLG